MLEILNGFNLLNNVGVLQVLQQADLSDGSARDAVVFFLQSDLLNGYQFTSLGVESLVDDSVGALSQLLLLNVLLKPFNSTVGLFEVKRVVPPGVEV